MVTVLNKANVILNVPRPMKEKKLPNVLSQNEVIRILENVKNQKHKTIMFLIYSSRIDTILYTVVVLLRNLFIFVINRGDSIEFKIYSG